MPKIFNFDKLFTKEFLYEEYIVKQKNTTQISKENDCCDETIRSYLHIHNIKIRKVGKIRENLIGKKFGPIKIIKKAFYKEKDRDKSKWECKCECNRVFIMDITRIKEFANLSKCKCESTHAHKYKGTKNISGSSWQRIVKSANKRCILVSINLNYIDDLLIKQNFKCALSGVPIKLSIKYNDKIITTASLDRIDSKKGYIEGNVQWVHKKVNYMKHIMSNEELINWCHLISNLNKV